MRRIKERRRRDSSEMLDFTMRPLNYSPLFAPPAWISPNYPEIRNVYRICRVTQKRLDPIKYDEYVAIVLIFLAESLIYRL